jgi:hypothetical protein
LDVSPELPTGQELLALNRELVDFDLGAVEIEELERRFEMALAAVDVSPDATCTCPELVSCGTFCIKPPPA